MPEDIGVEVDEVMLLEEVRLVSVDWLIREISRARMCCLREKCGGVVVCEVGMFVNELRCFALLPLMVLKADALVVLYACRKSEFSGCRRLEFSRDAY